MYRPTLLKIVVKYVEMDQLDLIKGCKLLLLWGANNASESVKDAVNVLMQKVGADGKVQVEHVERLQLCKYTHYVHELI